MYFVGNLFKRTNDSDAKMTNPALSPAKVPFRLMSNGLQLTSSEDSVITPSLPNDRVLLVLWYKVKH